MIYDIAKNEGFLHVGISSDTAEFAVNSIRTWWKEMGQEQYNDSKKIYITAEGVIVHEEDFGKQNCKNYPPK